MDDFRQQNDQDFMASAKEDLEELEVIRKAKKKVYEFRKRIGVPIAGLLAIPSLYIDYLLLFTFGGGSDDDGGAGLTIVLLGAAWWWITQPKRQYAKAYKEKILPRLAKLFGNLTYQIDGKIDMDVMQPSKIVPHHHKYKTEDHFKGTFKGVDLEFSEIELKQRRRSNKRTRYVTVFKGVAVLLKMQKKKFHGHTILERNAGKISEWFKERSKGLKRANLVDPEFEKIFDVYTNDQVEARYLIDPIMIESLKELDEEFKKYKPRRFYETSDKASFFASVLGLTKFQGVRNHFQHKKGAITSAYYENKMLILISSPHNHFEPADLTVPATDEESLLQMKHEIGKILSIIDKLNLYDPRHVETEERESNSVTDTTQQILGSPLR